MPWTSKQMGMFGSDLGRKREGMKTRTGMSEEEMEKAMHEGVRKPGAGMLKKKMAKRRKRHG